MLSSMRCLPKYRELELLNKRFGRMSSPVLRSLAERFLYRWCVGIAMRSVSGVVVMAMVLVIVVGNSCEEQESQVSAREKADALKVAKEALNAAAVCGSYRYEPGMALFNVSGRFDVLPERGSEVFLHPTKNTSLGYAIHVADDCMPFWKSPVNESGYFRVDYLSAGKYVLYIPVNRFDGVMGFGRFEGLDSDDYEVVTLWVGGDQRWNIVVFEIRRV